MPKRLTITVLAVLMCAFAEAHATEPVSKEAEFKDRMDKLDPRNSQKDRLEALKWIIERSKESQAKAALPGLELYGKNEKDDEVRAEVVLSIGRIGLDLRHRME